MDDSLLMRGFQRLRDLLAIGKASSSGIGSFAMRSANVGPSTSSITSASVPSDFSRPWMCAMFGWFRAARTSASRWNRARRSGSAADGLGQDLDRDLALEVRVRGAIDLAHPARAERRDDFVGAQASTG